jgi:hypothetical protein
MLKGDFRVVHNFYTTSSLTMIFHKDIIVASVETYKNYKTVVEDNTDSKKPAKLKTSKEKRTPKEITDECDRIIKNFCL